MTDDESRSVQKRKAIQRGEPMPTFAPKRDYASELAERWSNSSESRSEREAIEGAIREALARAAEVAEAFERDMCRGPECATMIRALGAREGG